MSPDWPPDVWRSTPGGRATPPTRWRPSLERYPGAELFTIVGDDAAAGLHTWERFEEVIAQSSLVVVDRPGEAVQLPDDVAWIHVEVPHLEVSSTDLRARFNDGRPLDYLLTDAVLTIIERRGLYTMVPAR